MKLLKTNSLRFRFIATVTMYCFVLQIILPLFTSFNIARAQSGPSQAETSGFSLNSTSGMVNKFTGDFSYSIPLMDVEGYPITISYNQNISMDSEASWVGLGWDLSLGSVSRSLRGLPDDFNGTDLIKREYKVQDNITYKGIKGGKTVSAGIGLESSPANFSFGLTGLIGRYKNTYNGEGNTLDFNIAGSFSYGENLNAGLNLGIGFNYDSQNGIGRSFSVGLSGGAKGGDSGLSGGLSASYTGNFHSRTGKNSNVIGLSANVGTMRQTNDQRLSNNGRGFVGSVQSLGTLTTIPRAEFPFHSDASMTQFEMAKFLITGFGNGGTAKLEKSTVGVKYDYDHKLKYILTHQRAFGYFHYGKRNDVDEQLLSPVMDFNFGRASEISERSKKLPFSVPTYDMFSFSAAGSGGQFRGQRHDVGTLRGSTVVTTSEGNSNVFKTGVGTINGGIGFKGGYTHASQEGEKKSGEWILNGNETFEYESNSSDDFDKTIFFKSVGEKTPTDMGVYSQLGGKAPVQRYPVDLGSGVVSVSNTMSNAANISSLTLPQTGKNVIRATEYLMKTAKEKENEYSSTSQIVFKQDINSSYDSPDDYNQRVNSDLEISPGVYGVKKDHHLSATEVIDPSGMRYIYDIPVYSIESQEVMFSAAGLNNSSTFSNYGLITYAAGVHNTQVNSLGKAQLFDKTTTPGYAHSFLLTEVLSSNYIDVDNNGPTTNDIGNYYKFNYSQVYGESDPYTWRKPFSGKPGTDTPKAYFNDNFKATVEDDIANYSYGKKEVYLVHSVESKNMVAEFLISERKDAYGQDENGFIDIGMPGYRLDSIVLYNKNERKNNPNATPLSTVIFDYDYSLCRNFPLNINSNISGNYAQSGNYAESGKLTLKRIRFKNRNSEEYALAPYEFHYGTEGHIPSSTNEDPINRDYSTLNVDRWGNYKSNDPNYPNRDYPYADQNPINANTSASNWKLNEIRTPQNGLISVDYEADEYSFVQDKRVMNHKKIMGMVNPMRLSLLMNQDYSNIAPNDLSQNLRTSSSEFSQLFSDVDNATNTSGGLNSITINGLIFGQIGYKLDLGNLNVELPNNILIFELDDPYSYDPSTQSKSEVENQFRNDYLRDDKGNLLEEVFCKTKVKIDPNENKYENIPTFAKISSQIPAKYNLIFSLLGLNPINSHGLLGNGSQLKYGYIVLETEGVKDPIYDKNGNPKYPNSPYRLNPIHKTAMEFGRTHLPEIVYADCNQSNCDYGLSSLDVVTIFGGDVNKKMNKEDFCLSFDSDESFVRLFVQKRRKYTSNARVSKITYHDNWLEMTNNGLTSENGSTYIWSYKYNDFRIPTYNGVSAYEPQIGNDVNPLYQWTRYSNIVKSFPDQNMYTPEPFAELLYPAPIIGYEEVSVQFENQNPHNSTGRSVSKFYTSKDFPTISDFTAVKSRESKRRGLLKTAKAIAMTQGFYVQTNDFHGKPRESKIFDGLGNLQSQSKYNYLNLNNEVNTLDRAANKVTETIATEYDVYAQTSYVKTKSHSYSYGGSLYLGWYLPNPIPFYVSFSPDVTRVETENGIYVNTFNKIINRSAIVESIETEYLGSHNSARNIAYDRYSGNVIVSSLRDEYNDELISMNYPAHWKYDNFRNHHRSNTSALGVIIKGATFNDATHSFTEGDIVRITSGSSTYAAQILKKENASYWLINIDGSPFSNGTLNNANIYLEKTMRKNRLGLVMQQVTTKDGSFLSNTKYNPRDNIISNSVLTFEESGAIACGLPIPNQDPPVNMDPGTTINPFTYGLKGIYRKVIGFALQTDRTNFDNNLGTRFDGIIDQYKPFYDLSTSTNNPNEWMSINEVDHPNYPSPIPTNFDFFQGYRKLGDINKIDEYGKIIESVNQVDIKSAVLFGYNKDLKLMPVAQATNAQQNDIAFDGFEDYNYFPGLNPNYSLKEAHFNFDIPGTNLTMLERHSGLKSAVVLPGESISNSKIIGSIPDLGDCPDGFDKENALYTLQECDCVSDFSPNPGKYVVSAWVKVQDGELLTSYDNTALGISIDAAPQIIFRPTGNIIDGWQRIEGVFDIGQNASEIEASLINEESSKEVYFDDFRIHPYNAGMTTIVYDPNTLLPMARHDAYNYTTFFNYDENYDLVSIKVETIEGVKTISASDKGFVKYFNPNN